MAEAAGIEKNFFSCISCNIQVIAPLKWQKIKNHGKILNYHFHMVTAVERREEKQRGCKLLAVRFQTKRWESGSRRQNKIERYIQMHFEGSIYDYIYG